jgi:hypothetical protein
MMIKNKTIKLYIFHFLTYFLFYLFDICLIEFLFPLSALDFEIDVLCRVFVLGVIIEAALPLLLIFFSFY